VDRHASTSPSWRLSQALPPFRDCNRVCVTFSEGFFLRRAPLAQQCVYTLEEIIPRPLPLPCLPSFFPFHHTLYIQPPPPVNVVNLDGPRSVYGDVMSSSQVKTPAAVPARQNTVKLRILEPATVTSRRGAAPTGHGTAAPPRYRHLRPSRGLDLAAHGTRCPRPARRQHPVGRAR
jgi:hypothetical protein